MLCRGALPPRRSRVPLNEKALVRLLLGSGSVPGRSAAVLRKARRTEYTPFPRHKQRSEKNEERLALPMIVVERVEWPISTPAVVLCSAGKATSRPVTLKPQRSRRGDSRVCPRSRKGIPDGSRQPAHRPV